MAFSGNQDFLPVGRGERYGVCPKDTSALAFARDRFIARIGTNIEVTNAQASVTRARDNQIEALFRFNASRINLARAKGEIEKLF